MRVILVDDEKKFINMLAKRLKFRGFDPIVAVNGEEAIKIASQTQFEVAVLDIKMPGISGLQLKHELAAGNPDLKFIFVTGHGAIDKNDENFNPDDIYLSKPLDIEILINTMKKIVK
jgi:DNA-binding NtrC family response regulator